MTRRRIAALALVALLAGCGGAHAVPPSVAGAGATNNVPAQGTARFTLTIPNRGILTGTARAPQYVSASTLSAAITANPGGVATTVDLSVASPLCQTVSGGRACTIPVSAPIGANDTFAVLLYSGACTGGPPCVPQGTPLSGASNFGPVAVTEGQANITAPLVLGGIPASVDVSANALVSGQAVTVPLTVTAYDSAANVIIGPAAYADATGASAPLTVALAIVPYSNQITLHNGAQNSTSITVAGPTDTPTLQLSAPANVIGIPFTVTTQAAALLPAHSSQIIALLGTLNATLLTTNAVYSPDYTLYAPMNVNSGTGLPNGFVLDFGSQSNGGDIGYFNSGSVPESLNVCTVPGAQADAGVSPIDGGVAFAYSAGLFTDTNPWGLNRLPLAAFTGGACPAGKPYETDTLGTPDSVVRSMAYDPVAHNLITGGDSSFIQPSGPTVNPSLRYNGFNGATFTSNTIIANNLATPIVSLVNVRSRRFYLLGSTGTIIYTQTGVSAPTSTAVGGTSLSTVVAGYDGRAYALDDSAKTVYAWDGSTAATRYTAGAFVNMPPAVQWHLTMGPDGTAFADNGVRTVESLPTSGASTSIAIPTVSGSGLVDAVFDGGNGYVYAVINDGLHNGTINVVRISR